ncbi:MAG: 3-isopropylmalate dehydratase large subunit [Candidatus Methanomethylicota archaeon]|uniref:3-isopropylmalate dehydratase large subunit n=1 Tax=Thermoproteota archaeon TaxID=2056631 RepID=A0A497EQG8_9CREN|nr:MAG: 3-isopropylmalate dehydratase large subunit [Candidatus Verstraetearchaeota archaeon]
MGMTLAEKIFSAKVGKAVSPGDIVAVSIDAAMAHDGTAPLMIRSFESMGAKKVWDPSKAVLVIDHVTPSPNEGSSSLHKMMREFAKKHGLTLLENEGICHQVMPEKGYIWPGTVVVGADSHTCTYGAFGAFATGIGSTEMAAVFASGKLWFKVPESLKVKVEGSYPKYVSSKDVVLHVIGEIKADGATYMAIEYVGQAVKALSVDGRMVLTNMAVEMGAKTGLVAPDNKTLEFLKGRIPNNVEVKAFEGDSDAHYADELFVDVSSLEPQVACPHSVDNVKPISEVEGIPIDQVFIGSCTNGRLEDLEITAKILRGRKVKVRTIVIPASREVYLKALREGLVEVLIEAGCVVAPPGCGPCAGGHLGVPSPGDKVLSTTNRNFKGRMGTADAEIYLASPAVAAATALKGEIVDPREEGQ